MTFTPPDQHCFECDGMHPVFEDGCPFVRELKRKPHAQPQYYEAVPVETKPTVAGWYNCINVNNIPQSVGLRWFNSHEFEKAEWNYSPISHWLRPLSPSLQNAVLEKLDEVLKNHGYDSLLTAQKTCMFPRYNGQLFKVTIEKSNDL